MRQSERQAPRACLAEDGAESFGSEVLELVEAEIEIDAVGLGDGGACLGGLGEGGA